MPPIASKLDKFLSIRTRIIGDFKHHVAEATKLNDTNDATLIGFRSIALEKTFKEFVEISEELEKMQAFHELENLANLLAENRQIEDSYFTVKLHLSKLLPNEAAALNASFFETTRRSFAESAAPNMNLTGQPETGVKLQKIVIPPFDGKIEEWPEFKDMFLSLMKKYRGDEVEQFTHLKNYLRGEARDVVKHLGPRNESYETALELLVGQYENKNAIIEAHLTNFMDIPTVSKQSASSIRHAINTTKCCLAAIKGYDIMVDTWDPIIVYTLKQKLAPDLRGKYEEERKGSHEPATLKDFLGFLEVWHKIVLATPKKITPKPGAPEGRPKLIKAFVNTDIEGIESTHIEESVATNETAEENDDVDSFMHARAEVCGVCEKNHRVFMCPKLAANSHEALRLVNEKQLCTNCLYGHEISKCISRGVCKRCQKKHHTLLHDALNEVHIMTQQMLHNKAPPIRGLLATALVPVVMANGQTTILRTLIDDGSTGSLISERGAQLIRCHREGITSVPMYGVGNVQTGTSRFKTSLVIGSIHCKDFQLAITAYITPHITTIRPITRKAINTWDHIKGLSLADPSGTDCSNIDLLLGTIPHGQLIEEGLIKGRDDEPVARRSKLGWLISGACTNDESLQNFFMETEYFHMSKNDDLSQQLKGFWEIEEAPFKKEWSKEEKECDEYFTKTITRAEDGKFVMRIPFNLNPNAPNFLGASFENAKQRFLQLERRFARNPQLKIDYAKGIHEYLDLGHAAKVPMSQLCHVIPHHAVIKENSTTTKLRTVYDASAKTTNGFSLNNRMHIGPTLLEELWAVLIRWRMKKVAITGDMEKMYRQFWIHPNDTKYLQILWRNCRDEPFQLLELKTVTFGTAAAPYMAIKGLHLIAEKAADEQPKIAHSIKKCFYVDDYLESFDTVEEALLHQAQLVNTVSPYGLNLRKWNSNADCFKHDEVIHIKTHPNELCTALGMQWDTAHDQISYKVALKKEGAKITKRTVLSAIASLFDPLGLLAPVVMQAKIFMQQLWLLKIGWDDLLPPETQKDWGNIKAALLRCSKCRLPRWLGYSDSHQHVSLHGFCDASEKMYAAACYLRTVHSDGTIEVHLITAKTKVAPTKTVSIPRLELCAALLLAKLMAHLKEILQIDELHNVAWTDSAITLAWISTPAHQLNTFVSNRVSKIQALISPDEWRHVRTDQNPADCATRTGNELFTLAQWWNGPTFLLSEPDAWPRTPKSMIAMKNMPEAKKKMVIMQTKVDETLTESFMLQRYSSLCRLLRITAYCLRVKMEFRELRNGPGLSTAELSNARKHWIKQVQQGHYAHEIQLLQSNKPLPAKSTLLSLNPMLDVNGILRVRGRLKHAFLSYEAKHPIILPVNSSFTRLIINVAHLKAHHGGLQLTLRTIRDEFWLVRGKAVVKAQLKSCVKCCRQNAHPAQQQMADLLAPQVQPNRPFSHTGVDFAGHFEVKMSTRRNAPTTKCYVSLFICLTTKAVHLELAHDLSTQAFIAVLSRFVSRRGIPNHMYSDRGTNFIGTEKELPRLWYNTESKESQTILKVLADNQITWHFNPARASHFGGLWEAGVKSMKTHLHRVVRHTKLNYEDFNTLIIQIEASMNSRPLCQLSEDPDDLTVLTPGHFLIGQAPITLPYPDVRDYPMTRLSRYQFIQKLHQSFWDQWSHEYLTRLQQRPKWKQPHNNLKKGQIVIIKEDDVPPTKWILGKIVETFPGQDGLVRSALVQCKGDPATKAKPIVVSRPIHKLCLLPIEDNMNVEERAIYDKSLVRGEDVDVNVLIVK